VREKMKLEVKYLEHGKTKTIILNNNAEQIEFWNRQRKGEVSVIETKKIE